MSKTIVKKIQIAQAVECVVRLDKYVKFLDIARDILEFAKQASQYNQLQDEFKQDARKSIDTILLDIRSLKADAQEMALIKSDRAKELRETRIRQLENRLGGEE